MISPLSALLHFLWVFVDGTWISSVSFFAVCGHLFLLSVSPFLFSLSHASPFFVKSVYLHIKTVFSDRFKQHFDEKWQTG